MSNDLLKDFKIFIQKPLNAFASVCSFNSVSNICITPDNRLMLGVIYSYMDGKRSIPETGHLVLIGGAKPMDCRPTAPLISKADIHLRDALGTLDRDDENHLARCTELRHVDYDMRKIDRPLETAFDIPVRIKRITFDRVVFLTQEEVDRIENNPNLSEHSKINKLIFITESQFEYRVAESDDISFPFQIDHVRKAFALGGKMPEPAAW